MTDKKSAGISPPPVIIIFIIVIIAVLALPLMLLSEAGNIMNDYNNLDEESCQKIVINDTFSQIRGHFGSSTYYYIATNDNKIYEMVVGENATKMYNWKIIVKGQEYNVKLYKEYAEFCGDNVFRIGK